MVKTEKNIELYQSLVKNSFNEIYTFDALSYKFIYLNPSALNNLGYTMEDMIELTPIDIKPDYDTNTFEKLISPLKKKKKEKIQFCTNHKRKDGTIYPVEVHLQLNSNEKTQYFSAFILDITERKELETNLIESNNIINASPIVVFKFGNKDKWDTKFVTENVIDLLGYSASDFLNNEIEYKDVIHQEDFNHVEKEILNYYKTNKNKKLVQEYRVITKKGTIKWVRDFPSVKKGKDQNNIHFTAILQDITEQKETENALKLSEKKFKDLFNKSSDALLIIKNNIFIDCNIATCKMLGYATKNEFLNVHPSKLSPSIQPDGKNSFKKADEMMRLAFKKGSHKFEWIHTKKNGDDFPVEVLLTTIHNEPNNKVVYCVWRDITEHKKAELIIKESEQELHQKNQILKNHIVNTPLAAIQVDTQSIIKEWNLAAEKIFGYSAKEAIGKNIIDLIVPKNKTAAIKDLCHTVFSNTNGKQSFNQNITKQGKTIYCNWYNTLLTDENNKPIGSASLVNDITIQHNLENTIKQLEKNISLKVGKNYFNTLAKELNKILKADYIFIGTYNKEDNTSNSLSYLKKQTILPNIIYDLAGTPCEIVSKNGFCFYSEGVAEIFSKDAYLKDFKITGYIGTAIYNAEKQIIGQLVALYRKPITDESFIKSLLSLFADKIGTELERNKLIEKLLVNKKDMLRVQEVANLGFYILDIKKLRWTSSEILDKIFGLNKAINRDFNTWVDLIHPEDKKDMVLYFENNILKNHENFKKEYRIIKQDTKETIWIYDKAELEFDDNGTLIRIVGTIQDITNRKETDKVLHENERRLSSIYNTVGDIIFSLDVLSEDVYKFNSVNATYCNITGLTEDMIIGKLVSEVIPEPTLSFVLKKYQQAITKNSIVRWEETTNYPKGELTGEVSIAPVFDVHGQCIYLVGSVHDITERKKAELIIKESEHSLLEAQKIAKIGSYNQNIKTQISKTSANFNDIIGIDLNSELTFAVWETISYPEDNDTINKELEKCIRTGEKFDLEYRILTKNTQELKWIHGLGEVILKNGKPTNFYGTIQDITQQKRAQFDLENAYSQVEQLKNQLEMENISLKEEIALSFSYEDMIYSSQEISDVLTQVEQVSSTDATVLILGETGTGKELIAKAIHNTSNRKSKPLIRVNCAAIPTELIESELFGHIKGSFTGAINNRIGKFELADGGTLFLDEIGELQLALQPKLLRAIQEGEIEPIGSSKNRKLDVRIIAATNKDLQKEAEEKRFREDLYFRLNVFPITIPPLRERIEDIPVLIDHFVNKFCKKHGKEIKYISELTMQQMKSYAWPGNVRELENLIERAVIISNQELLLIKEFETSTKKKDIKHSSTALVEVQRNHIIKILNETQWKIDGKEGAAVLLDIKPSTLRDRMKKFGIVRP